MVEGNLESLVLERQQSAEIDVMGWQRCEFFDVGGSEQAAVEERLQGDEQRVAGKGRRAGVRRVAEAGRAQRQNLPQRLFGGGQIVEEVERRLAEVANAVRARQRSRVEQHPAAAPI